MVAPGVSPGIGNQYGRKPAKRAAERQNNLCRPLRGLILKKLNSNPALKGWATFNRPLARTKST